MEYASKTLKCDREIILVSIKQNAYSLYYVSDELLKDKSIILLCIKNGLNEENICHFGITLKKLICETLQFYEKSFDELKIILRASKLTLRDAGAKIFTICDKELNENTNLYNIKLISMSGCEYIIDNIENNTTFNDLANKLYNLENSHNNIIFINNKNKYFDLVKFNKNVVINS